MSINDSIKSGYINPNLTVVVDNVSNPNGVSLDQTKNINTLANTPIPSYPIVVVSPSSQIITATFNYSTIDTNKPEKISNSILVMDAVVDEFLSDLEKISEAGKSAEKEKTNFTKKVQSRAVHDLAKIIGIHDKYFKNVAAHQTYILMQELRKKIGIAENKKTTAFHLLSRQYRGNDTRQASADAKILNYAYELEKNEHTFSQWIFDCGGLNAAKEKSIEYEKEQAKKNDPNPYKAPSVAKQKALFNAMEKSVQNIAKAQQTTDVFSIKKSELPEMFSTLRPYGGSNWRVFAVNVEEGEDAEGYAETVLHFHAFHNKVPDHGRLYKGTRLDASGTSDSAWPEWMLEKKAD